MTDKLIDAITTTIQVAELAADVATGGMTTALKHAVADQARDAVIDPDADPQQSDRPRRRRRGMDFER